MPGPIHVREQLDLFSILLGMAYCLIGMLSLLVQIGSALVLSFADRVHSLLESALSAGGLLHDETLILPFTTIGDLVRQHTMTLAIQSKLTWS